MKVKEAQRIVGGVLGEASKMPCRTYGLPAAECRVGSQLRMAPNTPCSKCYCYNRGRYRQHKTIQAQYRRLDSLQHPQWVDAMVTLIGKQSPTYFRFHDSGDLQGVWHLDKIVQVARRLPNTRFWMPTQERHIVQQWRKANGALPSNLCIRVSAVMLGSYAGTYRNDPELAGSMVVTEDRLDVYNCPARHQGNQCGDCRACWDRNVKMVAYHLH